MIKILFLIPTLGHGGAERVLVNLVNHMDKSVFDITVQTMFDTGIYQSQLDKKVKYIGGLPFYFRGNTVLYKLLPPHLLYKLYIKKDYDIIVSYLQGTSARVVSGCTRPDTKLISWVHIQLVNEQQAYQVFRSKKEAQECYECFDEIACVSETVKEAFIKWFNVVCPINVYYNTVETEVIKNKAKEIVDDIVFSKEQFNIVSVGKLIKIKGYDRLVRILKKLREDGLNVHVYIVGIGEEQEKLQKMIDDFGLHEHWTFVGFRENPYKYVDKADLYVCSSHREGFSTAVTESIIVGTPVVSTDCSGAKELLGYNNEYGIVVENTEEALYHGIKKMFADKDLYNKYKNGMSKRADKFCTSETVKKVEDMLKDIVGRR